MKGGIDISDLLSSYHFAVRKSIRWYHKVPDDVIFGTAVVNPYFLYAIENPKANLLNFRIKLIYSLLNIPVEEKRVRTPRLAKPTNHYLEKSKAYSGSKQKRYV